MRHRPAYRRIMESIRGRIRAGDLSPGARVDSERRLAVAHGVSLMTARHALAQLETEGIVVRRPGSGTFVAEPERNAIATDSSDLLAFRGEPVEIRVLALAEDAIGRMLIERLFFRRDSPVAIETITVRGNLVAAEAVWTERSLARLLRRAFDLDSPRIEETIDAIAADGDAASRLGLSERTPLVRIRQSSAVAERITIVRSDLCPLTRSLA
jgi:GntR family transcriptional regulator